LYFRARDTAELDRIYQQLNELEPVEVDKQTLRPVQSLYMWPLGLGLVVSMLMATLMINRGH